MRVQRRIFYGENRSEYFRQISSVSPEAKLIFNKNPGSTQSSDFGLPSRLQHLLSTAPWVLRIHSMVHPLNDSGGREVCKSEMSRSSPDSAPESRSPFGINMN